MRFIQAFALIGATLASINAYGAEKSVVTSGVQILVDPTTDKYERPEGAKIRERKKIDEKGRWESLGIHGFKRKGIEEEYVQVIPAMTEKRKKELRYGDDTIVAAPVDFNLPLRWKKIGIEADESGEKSFIWIAKIKWIGAKGLSIQFENFDLNDGNEICVYGEGESDINYSRHNLCFGGRGPLNDGYFRTLAAPGDTVILEYHIRNPNHDPNGTEEFHIKMLNYYFEEGWLLGGLKGQRNNRIMSCSLEATELPDWLNSSMAVARIEFTSDADQKIHKLPETEPPLAGGYRPVG